MGKDSLPARPLSTGLYHVQMTEDEHIQRHLEICQRVYERLVAEGRWPWPDSQNSEDLVESKDPKTDI